MGKRPSILIRRMHILCSSHGTAVLVDESSHLSRTFVWRMALAYFHFTVMPYPNALIPVSISI